MPSHNNAALQGWDQESKGKSLICIQKNSKETDEILTVAPRRIPGRDCLLGPEFLRVGQGTQQALKVSWARFLGNLEGPQHLKARKAE